MYRTEGHASAFWIGNIVCDTEAEDMTQPIHCLGSICQCYISGEGFLIWFHYIVMYHFIYKLFDKTYAHR